jgi:hypothetical protein
LRLSDGHNVTAAREGECCNQRPQPFKRLRHRAVFLEYELRLPNITPMGNVREDVPAKADG